MRPNNYTTAESFSIRDGSVDWTEKDIQNLIASDPKILGLGPFSNVHCEHTQPQGGRVDLILSGDRNSARYVVEIQLGSTNPEHIIRTIEYWEQEQYARPDVDHVAVIVAEKITERFHNVIALLHRHMPIIAMKMTAIKVGDHSSILFTKVLDLRYRDKKSRAPKKKNAEPQIPGTGFPTHTSDNNRELVEKLIALAAQVAPKLVLSRHQKYTSFKSGSRNRLSFVPKRNDVTVYLHAHQAPEMDDLVQRIQPEYILNPTRGVYRFPLTLDEFATKRDLLREALALCVALEESA